MDALAGSSDPERPGMVRAFDETFSMISSGLSPSTATRRALEQFEKYEDVSAREAEVAGLALQEASARFKEAEALAASAREVSRRSQQASSAAKVRARNLVRNL